MLNEDYREMLQALIAEKARFLLVGAYALAAHGGHSGRVTASVSTES